jgi:hypothetical protein
VTEDRCDHQYRAFAALDHSAQHRRRQLLHGGDVEGDERPQVSGIGVRDPAEGAHARVVHEPRDLAFPELAGEPAALVWIGEVDDGDLGGHGGALVQLGGERLEPVLAAGDEHEIVAARGEPAGDRVADARRGAGDDHGGSGKG